MVAAISDDRPDRLVCVACLWLTECDMVWPRWARPAPHRTNLAGVFAKRAVTAP
jgi:hypothetical protein